MSFPRYPKYRDSGVEWLGEVPEHWEVKRLKKISPSMTVGVVVNPSTFVANEGLPFIYGGDIREGLIDWENARRIDVDSSEANSKTRLKAGDLLTVRVGAPGVTAVVPPACEGGNCASVMLIRQGGFNSYWLCYAMNTRIVRFQVEVVQYGAAQEQFNISHAVNFLVPTPLRAEQDWIAEFLDRETGKIDELVAEQQRLMELLKEKRQAVISHAVTKGLNPRASMKPSGIEWPEVVPAEWAVSRLKYLVAERDGIQMGPFGGMLLDLDSEETGFKVYGQENTISGDFSLGSRWISKERFALLHNYQIKNGDLLLTRKGSLGNARHVQDLPYPGIADSDTIRVRCNQGLIARAFLALLLHSARYVAEQITLSKRGAILPGLNSETIANISIILPPVAQQTELLGYIAAETVRIETLAAEAQKAIDLLQERRTALISAAVTGQIDVRKLAAA